MKNHPHCNNICFFVPFRFVPYLGSIFPRFLHIADWVDVASAISWMSGFSCRAVIPRPVSWSPGMKPLPDSAIWTADVGLKSEWHIMTASVHRLVVWVVFPPNWHALPADATYVMGWGVSVAMFVFFVKDASVAAELSGVVIELRVVCVSPAATDVINLHDDVSTTVVCGWYNKNNSTTMTLTSLITEDEMLGRKFPICRHENVHLKPTSNKKATVNSLLKSILIQLP